MATPARYVQHMPRKTKIAYAFITTPYVDAYEQGDNTFAWFTDMMCKQASWWGEEGITNATGVYGELVPTAPDGRLVLAIGSFDGVRYAAVQNADSSVELIELDYPENWNVT